MLTKLRHVGLCLAGALGCALVSGCDVLGYQNGYAPKQPVEFSHAMHAGELKLDCLYCHYTAERSRHAGVPALSVCMNCHLQVKKDSPDVQKLTAAWKGETPFAWVRVHRYPDFAWFSHRNHITQGGLKCQQCHGPVETMVRLRQEFPMTMGWCVNCHRDTAAKSGGKQTPPLDCASCHM